jgi:hypothetical protein
MRIKKFLLFGISKITTVEVLVADREEGGDDLVVDDLAEEGQAEDGNIKKYKSRLFVS